MKRRKGAWRPTWASRWRPSGKWCEKGSAFSETARWGVNKRAHVSLLDTVGFENVGRLADLLQKLLVGQLDVLSGLIRLPDDGGLSNESQLAPR